MALIKVKKEEGHYTIKRVDKLPKKGNANWLYALKSLKLDKFYRWDAFKSDFEEIQVGGGTSGINLESGVNISITGAGTEEDPLVISSTGGGAEYRLVDNRPTEESFSLTEDGNPVSTVALSTSLVASNPVENEYPNAADMLANQVDQTETFFQYVLDTDEYYEKLSASTASIGDYRLLSDTEVQTILDSNGYRVFRIKDIQDDAAPVNTTTGGRISFNYNTGTNKVTSVVFSQQYSDSISTFYDNRANYFYKLKFYNRNTKEYEFAEVTGWTQNGNYFIVDVTDTINASNLSINNRIELFFEIDEKSFEPTIETILPLGGIVVDGTKKYHISSGNIKPALQNAAHIDGKDTEIISNPDNADILTIDLTDYPYLQLQGGGFTESPSNIYSLTTNEEDGLLKQHLTLMSWRRGNLFISNFMNRIPSIEVLFQSFQNISNDYVDIYFNKIIQSSDLVIGNFSKVFTQNGDSATDITLTSITDSTGSAISSSTNRVRIYFTTVGTTDGSATFRIVANSLTDNYGNTSTFEETGEISLLAEIESIPNVIAYWKEGEGDNTSGTATKTDIVGSKVFSATGESNPSLVSNEWQFNGTNQGFRLVDASINALINADAKDFQLHYIGSFDANGTRILAATKTGFTGTSAWSFIFNNVGNALFGSQDSAGDFTNTSIIPTLESVGTNYLFSLKFHQKDLGSGVVSALDVYAKSENGIETSVLDIDLSTINVSEVSELFIGMRETTSKAFYDINFKSLVIANSSLNFDAIRNKLTV